eukprot:3834033-Amphidinium_carterae.1
MVAESERCTRNMLCPAQDCWNPNTRLKPAVRAGQTELASGRVLCSWKARRQEPALPPPTGAFKTYRL